MKLLDKRGGILMNRLFLSGSLIGLLIVSGCSSPTSEEANDVEMTLPTTEVSNQEVLDPTVEVIDASEEAETLEVEERFTPGTREDDNYVWMEGVIEKAEKIETGYRFTIVPWIDEAAGIIMIPSIEEAYDTLVVESENDLEIFWGTSGETLTFEALDIDEITRLVRVDVLLDDGATEEYPTGKITLMSLLVG